MIPNNIYAPFPFPLHLGFCIFATLFLIIQFFRKKHLYYILLILGIDLTFATQFNKITENELIGTVISVFFGFSLKYGFYPDLRLFCQPEHHIQSEFFGNADR